MYSRSVSFHKLYHKACHNHVLYQIKKQLPYVRPCYSVTNDSSPITLEFLRENRIDMVYPDIRPTIIKQSIMDSSVNEYIVRNVADIRACVSACAGGAGHHRRSLSPLFWIKTAVSNDRIEPTREMFEYIWANKYILNGLVFDVHNFTNGYIPPTMYSYKIAIEYIFRNMVLPFEREYGIQTPAIMIDGTEHITQIRHLSELRTYALNETTIINGFREKKPELRLILGRLFDNSLVAERNAIAFHEYP